MALVLALVAATLTAVSIAADPPALADCVSHHTNVDSTDPTRDGYGNSGNGYINTQTTLSNLQAAIWRSFEVWNDAQTSYVEFGWTDKNGGYTTPTPASDYMVNGMVQPPKFLPGQNLGYNTYDNFEVENYGAKEIFRYYIGGTLIGYSPTMSYNQGPIVDNDEHYNNCDSLWTDAYALQDQTATPSTWVNWGDVGCWANASVNDWYLHKVATTEFQVNQTVGGWGNGCIKP